MFFFQFSRMGISPLKDTSIAIFLKIPFCIHGTGTTGFFGVVAVTQFSEGFCFW